MPINYYCAIAMNGSDIEMNRNELLLPVIDNETSAPATGSEVEGQMYYNTTTNIMYFYNGSAWVEMDGTGSGVSSLAGGTSTYITNSVNVSTGAVTLTSTLAGGSGTSTEFYRGDGTWATPAGAYTSWTLDGDTGTPQAIADGNTASFVGGTGIDTAVSATDTLTITNTGVTSIAAGTGISVSGSTGAVTVTNTVANTTSLGIANSGGTEQFTVTDTVDLQFAASGGASVAFDSTNKRVTYTAPSNTNETYTLPVAAGGANSAVLNLTAGGTGSGIKSAVTINGTASQIAVSESAGNNGSVTIGLPTDVVIAGDLTVSGGDITLGGTGRIQGIDTVSAGTDAASKAYVDGLVTGGLTFKDGFNAGSGAIDGGGNLTTGGSRVAISVGDYYVVTTSGSFYGSVQLDDGDSVICKQDAAAGTSDINDWVIVQSDEGVSQFSSGNAVSASTGQAITSQTASVGSVSVQSFGYNGGSNVGHVPSGGSNSTFLRGDGTWVTPTNSGGTITSIDITETGTALTITETGTATDPDFNISGAGTSSQVVLGDLTLGTLPVSGVTSVNFKTDGTALNVASNTITGSGTMTGVWQGTTSQYVNGEGDLITFPTIPQGDVTGVTASTTNDEKGIIVASSSGPVPVVGLDIKGQTNLASAPATNDELIIYDTSTDTNKAVTVANLAAATHDANSYAATITGFGTITHNLGSYDVIVQLYNATNYETIYACVDRTSTNQVGISGNSFPAGNIRVLVSKVIA
jgi:hypothetical protein